METLSKVSGGETGGIEPDIAYGVLRSSGSGLSLFADTAKVFAALVAHCVPRLFHASRANYPASSCLVIRS